ncbi:hypothetical protein [Lutibacter sp.]
MKSTSLYNNIKEPHLKVIKNTIKRKKRTISRIYINTLIPDFSYTNNLGENTTPKNYVLL